MEVIAEQRPLQDLCSPAPKRAASSASSARGRVAFAADGRCGAAARLLLNAPENPEQRQPKSPFLRENMEIVAENHNSFEIGTNIL